MYSIKTESGKLLSTFLRNIVYFFSFRTGLSWSHLISRFRLQPKRPAPATEHDYRPNDQLAGSIRYLGLNDGEGGEGAAAHGVRHLGCSLQQAGVKVEHVTRVGLHILHNK